MCAGVLLAVSGCWNGERATHPKVAPGKRLSLVEIGEQALDAGLEHEEAGRYREALADYDRALWAFRYHQRLTGREPLLMQDAQESARRVRTHLDTNGHERF